MNVSTVFAFAYIFKHWRVGSICAEEDDDSN